MDINKKRFFLAGTDLKVGFKSYMFKDDDELGQTLAELIKLNSFQLNENERLCYIENNTVTHIFSLKEAKRILKLEKL